VLYEVVPLFLIARELREGLWLVGLTVLVPIAMMLTPRGDYNVWMETSGRWIVLLIYLPCLVILLRRHVTELMLRRLSVRSLFRDNSELVGRSAGTGQKGGQIDDAYERQTCGSPGGVDGPA
jgi:hypothetical protein